VNPSGKWVYVTNQYAAGATSGNGTVTEISNNVVYNSYAVVLDPVSVAVSPDGSWVYVADYGSSMVSVSGTSGGFTSEPAGLDPAAVVVGGTETFPALTSVVPLSGQVTATWNSVPGATSYILYANGTQVYSGLATSYVATGLTNNTAYSFTVATTGSWGVSAPSLPMTATPEAVPAAPTAVTAVGGSSSILVTWTAPVTQTPQQPITYSIYKSANAGSYTLAASGLSQLYDNISSTAGTSYTFEVTATDAYGQTSGYGVSNSVTPFTLSRIQAGDSGSSMVASGTAANVVTANVVVGHTIVLGIKVASTTQGDITAVTSPMGTFVKVVAYAAAGAGGDQEWWLCYGATTAAKAVTVTTSDGATWTATATELSTTAGVTLSAVSFTNTGTGTSSSAVFPSLSLGYSDPLFAMTEVGSGDLLTGPSSWTNYSADLWATTGSQDMSYYSANINSVTATWTQASATWQTVAIALQ
jgi:hypothetical protein